jgi:hypothetical protein
MQVKSLDGQIQNWQLTGHFSHGKMENKSEPHLRARELLKNCYPTIPILEEVTIPVRRSDVLYVDFYIPMLRTAVEVHGEQHYKFIKFYHHDRLGFLRSQKRDREKIEWCDINNIKYIELPYNEDEESWRKRIND